MANLPSFRPRATLGYLNQNGQISPSAEFLRWLDEFRQQVDASSNVTTDVNLVATPVAVVDVPQADLSSGVVAVVETMQPDLGPV